MEVTVNGVARSLDGPTSIQSLLGEMGVDAAQVAVERNFEVVSRSVFDQTLLAPGDTLEVVRFMCGG